jgi:hypothetical protein
MKALLGETDWLASTPLFYDPRTGVADVNIWQVILAVGAPVDFHAEGLYNYLDFGYSVFQQTPVAGVRFLPPSARLYRDVTGTLEVEPLADPVEQWCDYRLGEHDVIELIRERVRAWEAGLPPDQAIVLPLSGGFDSRLLLWCLRDKSRVRSYTFGLSADQERSTEVVFARALAEHFGVRWERIPLNEFHRHVADWDAAFGVSTHAHGMYHFEFYSKIRACFKGEHAFLSGIIGDAWAGSIPPRHLRAPADLTTLGYSHGMRADPTQLRLSAPLRLRNQFWFDHRDRLRDHRFQVITSMRFKLMLLSYLMRVPSLFGFQPWTPYLDIDIAMAMLNLPAERRANRQWQRDFFAKIGLDLENQGMNSNSSNSLNRQALKRYPVPVLDSALMGRFFDIDYINWINKTVGLTSFSELRYKLLSVPKVRGVLRLLGVRDRNMEAYFAYLCLKPIENLLHRQRDVRSV